MIAREKAIKILNTHLKNKNLFSHCLAVEAAMKSLAKYFREDEEKWGLVRLLHDGDWEKTKDNPHHHTLMMVKWLKNAGENDQAIIEAILSHNYSHTKNNPPKNKMVWALYTADELTGLIVAVALVIPDKKIKSVSVESVLKKFPSKSFAAGVNREQIKLCQEKLGIQLPQFIEIVLSGIKNIAQEIGL